MRNTWSQHRSCDKMLGEHGQAQGGMLAPNCSRTTRTKSTIEEYGKWRACPIDLSQVAARDPCGLHHGAPSGSLVSTIRCITCSRGYYQGTPPRYQTRRQLAGCGRPVSVCVYDATYTLIKILELGELVSIEKQLAKN